MRASRCSARRRVCGLEDLQDHRDDCTYVPYLSPRLKAASRSPGSLELVPRNRSRTSVFGYPTPRGSFRANHLRRSCLEGFDRGDDRASRLAALPDEDLGSGEGPRSRRHREQPIQRRILHLRCERTYLAGENGTYTIECAVVFGLRVRLNRRCFRVVFGATAGPRLTQGANRPSLMWGTP